MSALAISNIDHVVVRTADVERAIRFYCDVLGCDVVRRVERLGLIQMRAGASMIDLVDAKGAPPEGPGNMDHFALRLERFEDAELRAHLSAHGVEATETKSRFGAEGDGPSCTIQDPDGNTVELKGPAI